MIFCPRVAPTRERSVVVITSKIVLAEGRVKCRTERAFVNIVKAEVSGYQTKYAGSQQNGMALASAGVVQ